MKTADIDALRELHRLISRPHSVHAKFALALERAIAEVADPAIVTIPMYREGERMQMPAKWPVPRDPADEQ